MSSGGDDDQVGYDVFDNSVKRRRTTVVVDDVSTDLSNGASWLQPSTTDGAKSIRRTASNDTAVPTVVVVQSTSKNAVVCRRLQLTTANHELCTGTDGASVGLTLMDAVQLSVYECRRQFMFDRWNCSIEIDRKRVAVLDRGQSVVSDSVIFTSDMMALIKTYQCYSNAGSQRRAYNIFDLSSQNICETCGDIR